MKKLALLLILIAGALTSHAQTQVNMEFHHFLGNETFALNQTATAEAGYDFNLNRMEFYVAEIDLVHDGGQVTRVKDIYLLENVKSRQIHNLGSHAVTVLEEVRFYIGVDSVANHDDPMQYTTDHPLAPKNPSMHWGWSSGYRFVAMEGLTGNSMSQIFEIHALGDENYHQVIIPMNRTADNGELTIDVATDFVKALKTVDISSGKILHSNFGEAIPFLRDFASYVFSAYTAPATGTEEYLDENRLSIYPNPGTSGESKLKWQSPLSTSVEVQVHDASGRLILNKTLEPGLQEMNLPQVQSGVYVVTIHGEDAPMTTHRWVVSNE